MTIKKQQTLDAILEVVGQKQHGATLTDISAAVSAPKRTLQLLLKTLLDAGRIARHGNGRATKYFPSAPTAVPIEDGANAETQSTPSQDVFIPLSPRSQEVRARVQLPAGARRSVGYNRAFLESYRPNIDSYLSPEERDRLAQAGRTQAAPEAAGTYAKQILQRLLIDLSWNSSRLEGNTYSLLDTRRLLEFGEEPGERNRSDAQMILNHKGAIEFLVTAADEIGFNRYTILNLHSILAENLLPDEAAAGRLRRIQIGIDRSTFHPLGVPQVIEECFNQLLATAQAIHDPFEQALFCMVQIPYLQPFDDVNKRVSRLAANIPFIKTNLSPLSFDDVPRPLYIDATLAVYELNDITLLKDVFLWAYERTAERYAAVRQSLGEPDPFRQRHREGLRQVLGDIVRQSLNRHQAGTFITRWTAEHIPVDESERFRDIAESDLLSLHEGNFARLNVRPSQFAAWQNIWRMRDLTFPDPNPRYDFDRDRVTFVGVDGDRRVTCAISEEALRDHFRDDGDTPLKVFNKHRESIEAFARRKYLQAQAEDDGTIAIRTSDFVS